MDDVERLEMGLLRVAERAQVEADAGAPGCMVAVYVKLDVRHLLARHENGNGVDCDECLMLGTVKT